MRSAPPELHNVKPDDPLRLDVDGANGLCSGDAVQKGGDQRCDHFGQPATVADPRHGILLQRRCEKAFYDGGGHG
jgi:hypothetical protein